MSLDQEDYLRAILEKQEQTNQWLRWIFLIATMILVLLAGTRWSWWSLSVVVT